MHFVVVQKTLRNCLTDFFPPGSPPVKDNPEAFTQYEKRLSHFFDKHGMEISADAIRKTARDTCSDWSSEFVFDSDAIPVLEHFSKTKKTALVSNFDHPPFVKKLLGRHKIDRFFDCITISGKIDLHKPDPRIFHYTMEKLNLSPNEVVHIGDTSDETEGAAAAGIIPILIDRNYAENGLNVDYSNNNEDNKVHFDADIKIKKLSELIGMIE